MYIVPISEGAAYETEITVWGRNDIDVDDMQIGLVGSPTKVAKSFPKALKGAGQKTTLDGEEAADYIISALKEKLIIR